MTSPKALTPTLLAFALLVSCRSSRVDWDPARDPWARPSSPPADREPHPEVVARFRIDPSAATESALDLIDADIDGSGTDVDPDEDGEEARDPLEFDELIASVESSFPLILAALEELEIAEGELLAARGNFDLRLSAKGNSEVDGFYTNERAKVQIEQPLESFGASLFGGYKVGRGDFAVWDGGLKTRSGGEFSAGVRVPLLAGREIDKRRLALWQARVTRQQADPLVLMKRLEATRKAAGTYWKWVAAGQKLAIAERLLALAMDRDAGLRKLADEGEIARIVLVDNDRLIVERRSIVVAAERELQARSIELSLFWRDLEGHPVRPGRERLPREMPPPRDPELTLNERDVELALAQRPEIRWRELELESLRLGFEQAQNDLLPKLDVGIAGSQDVGGQVSTPDDKGPFELEAFVSFELPLQRSAARGKSRAIEGKAAKLQRELQMVRERLIADVQDQASALRQTWQRLDLVRQNVRLAGTLEEAERRKLDQGASDIFRVNLREQQTAKAASSLVEVIAAHYLALADYRASLGLAYDELVPSR